jgi:hypothetical protein
MSLTVLMKVKWDGLVTGEDKIQILYGTCARIPYIETQYM